MIEKDKNENVEYIYSYKSTDGTKYWTPNAILAQARAEAYGTETVWMEKYEVAPLPEKPKKDLSE